MNSQEATLGKGRNVKTKLRSIGNFHATLLLPQNASLNFSCIKPTEDVVYDIYFPVLTDVESKASLKLNMTRKN